MVQERKTPLQVLKERRGPVPRQLTEQVKRNNAVKSAIRKALASGPKSVPEIAEMTGLPAAQVFWFLMSMRKYGQVVEDSQDGDYFRYALAKEAKSP